MQKRHGLLSQSGLGLFGLLESLVVLVLIAVFLFLTLGQRSQSIGFRDKDARKEFSQEGINTATYDTTVSGVNAKLRDVQTQLADRKKQSLETN